MDNTINRNKKTKNNTKNAKQSNFSLDKLITALSILIILGFSIYLFLQVRKLKKRNHLDKYNKNKDKVMHNICPDYYDIHNDGETCLNTLKIGKCKNTDPNFKKFFEENKNLFYNKDLQNEMKCKWARNCDVSWDGIDRLC